METIVFNKEIYNKIIYFDNAPEINILKVNCFITDKYRSIRLLKTKLSISISACDNQGEVLFIDKYFYPLIQTKFIPSGNQINYDYSPPIKCRPREENSGLLDCSKWKIEILLYDINLKDEENISLIHTDTPRI